MAIAARIGWMLKECNEEKRTQPDFQVEAVVLRGTDGTVQHRPARMETYQDGNRPGWSSFHTRTEIPFHARLDHTGKVSMMTDAPPDRGGLPFIETSSSRRAAGQAERSC